MILTCPNCNGQFNVDDNLIGEKGRKVKCSSCAEIWFQESDYPSPEQDIKEDIKEDIEEDIEVDLHDNNDVEDDDTMFEVDFVDTDLSPDEQPEEEDSLNADDKVSLGEIKRAVEIYDSRLINRSKHFGYSLAACLFVFIFVGILLNSGYLMNRYPSTQALYKVFGIYLEIPGKGLVFDGLVAQDDGETITVTGRIINLESETANVPMIEASLFDDLGKPLSQWYIQPPNDYLDGESDFSFSSIYYKSSNEDMPVVSEHDGQGDEDIDNTHGYEAGHVQVRFALLSKTDVKDDGNSSSHHQDGQSHQTDHEGSSKSHQSSSSAQHQEPLHAVH